MAPGDFVMLRISADFAFKVHVVALLYVFRVQGAAQMQLYLRRNWTEEKFSKNLILYVMRSYVYIWWNISTGLEKKVAVKY